MSKVIKRDGTVVDFDKSKIVSAIGKAFSEFYNVVDYSVVDSIASSIVDKLPDYDGVMTVEQIQDEVEHYLWQADEDVCRAYIRYRYKRQMAREHSKHIDSVLEIIDGRNHYVNEENSNKNPSIGSTQRDYMAGELSKEITETILLPDDIVKAHNNGEIHFHDEDYFAQYIHNCCLVNLDDMLQNGTVISGTMIERPHSFSTACNIATQVIAQVASNQYGGQSISLTHLAPFVDVSRKKIRDDVHTEFYDMIQNDEIDVMPSIETIERIVEKRLREEIKRGVQTIQYQIITLSSTNGQTPFCTLFMYLNEAGENKQAKEDLAMVIEEVLNQRIEGVKNEDGVWITPAFPKLIYVLEEDNTYEGGKYFYLTKLAAKCTAKRLVPDYISEKKMLEYKVDANGNGNCYPCMGELLLM